MIQNLRKRIYQSIHPYSGYSISEAIKNIVKGKRDEEFENSNWYDTDGNVVSSNIPDALWAKYLSIPVEDSKTKTKLEKSKYTPSQGNPELEYYKLPLKKREKEKLIEETSDLKLGENKNSTILTSYDLATHTIGRGKDKKGEYRSYYDRWDLNPFTDKYGGTNIPILNKLQDASFGIGKPIEIYDRIYLDDYYKVPHSGSTYLKEIIVTPQKKQGGKMNTLQFLKNGSGIHIKKENRGKFTDYCGGKVTSACIAKGKRSSNPAIRKRATFAANARKWKHEDGGKVKKHQAFVKGVSILDSNPDAYKFVKRKMRKAANGDNTSKWQNVGTKINNVMNSGVGQFATSLLSSLPSMLSKNNQVDQNAQVQIDQLEKPDFGKIYAEKKRARKLALQQQREAVNALTGTAINFNDDIDLNVPAYQEASKEFAVQKQNYENQKKQIKASTSSQKANIIGGAMNNIVGSLPDLISSFVNNKSTTTAPPTGTTTTSYSSYAPGYNPQPKNFTEYLALQNK